LLLAFLRTERQAVLATAINGQFTGIVTTLMPPPVRTQMSERLPLALNGDAPSPRGRSTGPARLMPLARALDACGLRIAASALADFALHPRPISKHSALKVKRAAGGWLDDGEGQSADLQRALAILVMMTLVQRTRPAESRSEVIDHG